LHTPLTDKPLTAAALSGVLTPFLEQANMISAATLAKERGIMVEEVSRGGADRLDLSAMGEL
jgi:D-3-phosphoglycerate dehydrogenase